MTKNKSATTKVDFNAVNPIFLNLDCPVTAKTKNNTALIINAQSIIQRNKYTLFPV